MPFKKYYCLYRAAWLESEARAAEIEANEKKQKAEEQQMAKSSQGRNPKMTQQEVLNRLHGLSTSGDLEDVVDDLM